MVASQVGIGSRRKPTDFLCSCNFVPIYAMQMSDLLLKILKQIERSCKYFSGVIYILLFIVNTGIHQECQYQRPPKKYSAAVIIIILLSSNIDEKRIAYKCPIQVQYSSTFVIDLTKLAHPVDIKRDAYGCWVQNVSHTDVFECSYDKDVINKAAPGALCSNMYYLQQIHCMHPSNSSF